MGAPLALDQIRSDLEAARQRVSDLEELERLAVKVYGERRPPEVAETRPEPLLAASTTKDAAIYVLRSTGADSMKLEEIVETMESLGWRTTSDKPREQVRQALTRLVESDAHVWRPGYGRFGYRELIPTDAITTDENGLTVVRSP